MLCVGLVGLACAVAEVDRTREHDSRWQRNENGGEVEQRTDGINMNTIGQGESGARDVDDELARSS